MLTVGIDDDDDATEWRDLLRYDLPSVARLELPGGGDDGMHAVRLPLIRIVDVTPHGNIWGPDLPSRVFRPDVVREPRGARCLRPRAAAVGAVMVHEVEHAVVNRHAEPPPRPNRSRRANLVCRRPNASGELFLARAE